MFNPQSLKQRKLVRPHRSSSVEMESITFQFLSHQTTVRLTKNADHKRVLIIVSTKCRNKIYPKILATRFLVKVLIVQIDSYDAFSVLAFWKLLTRQYILADVNLWVLHVRKWGSEHFLISIRLEGEINNFKDKMRISFWKIQYFSSKESKLS